MNINEIFDSFHPRTRAYIHTIQMPRDYITFYAAG